MSNILFINSLTRGGAERVAINITDETNIKLLLIWNDVEYDTGGTDINFLLNKKGNLFFDIIIATYRLIKYLSNNPEVKLINSHLFWANYIAIISSMFVSVKVVATHCVSFNSKFTKKPLKYLIHNILGKLLFHRADMNIFKSKAMQIEFQERFGISRKTSRVIYNPIDQKKIISMSSAEPPFEFDSSKKYILIVGRFHETKCQSKIINVLKKIPDQFDVIFLGDGEHMENCQALAKKLGVIDRVHFLGNVDNPFPFYLRCDLYASFSTSEGFPNALLEAISLNCYVIHSDCDTGPREILTKGNTISSTLVNTNNYEVYHNGILFDPFSEQAFLDAFFHYFDNFDECKHKTKDKSYLFSPNVIRSEYNSVISLFTK